MQAKDFHEVLYLNCESHCPWVTGVQALVRGQYGRIVKMY